MRVLACNLHGFPAAFAGRPFALRVTLPVSHLAAIEAFCSCFQLCQFTDFISGPNPSGLTGRAFQFMCRLAHAILPSSQGVAPLKCSLCNTFYYSYFPSGPFSVGSKAPPWGRRQSDFLTCPLILSLFPSVFLSSGLCPFSIASLSSSGRKEGPWDLCRRKTDRARKQ